MPRSLYLSLIILLVRRSLNIEDNISFSSCSNSPCPRELKLSCKNTSNTCPHPARSILHIFSWFLWQVGEIYLCASCSIYFADSTNDHSCERTPWSFRQNLGLLTSPRYNSSKWCVSRVICVSKSVLHVCAIRLSPRWFAEAYTVSVPIRNRSPDHVFFRVFWLQGPRLREPLMLASNN